MVISKSVGIAAGGIALTASLAGCGSSGGSVSGAVTAPAAPATSAGAGQGTGSPGGAMMATTSMLMVEKTKAMGSIVTDGKGYTLYRYAKDMTSMSMCADACTQQWMPVMPQGDLQGMGVKTGLISTITRTDGMKQVTLGGWPLYRYMGDAKPKEWKGQGMNNSWSAVTPAGKMAMGGMKMS